jgi:hypothetical protein
MEVLPPILIGSAVAAVIAVAVRRALRRRRARTQPDEAMSASRLASDVTFLALGVALMVLSVVVGQRLLSLEKPPRGALFPAGVGIAPQVRAKTDRSFVVGLAARFRDCDDPVDVTLAVAGTAEYFEDHEAKLKKRTSFTVAVPSTTVDEVAVGTSLDGYAEALDPLNASPGDAEQVGALETEPPSEIAGVTRIRGTIRGWSSHLAALVFRFKAKWLEERGLGTCYLKLPPLVGNSTILGAQAGIGRSAPSDEAYLERFLAEERVVNEADTLFVPYVRSLAIRNGVVVVDAGNNEVLSSEPETNTVAGGVPAIGCFRASPDTGDLGAVDADLVFGSDNRAGAIRDRSFADFVGQLDCGAVVTLAEASAASRRDLVLLIIGAVFSLGAALLLEIGLDIQRRRLAGAS